jgi:aryl-alcohol dehydrogenase-like predicted oxidoreductase
VAAMTLSTRKLGRTGMHVAILGFGAMELRGQPRGPAITDDDAGKVLNAVLDGGINLIDTSVDYGRSEELIGRYIGHRREEYFLASKCGCPLEPPPDATPPYAHDYRPANVRAGVEQSLRRLRTDRLDLVQVHMSPSRAQLEADGTVATLQALRDEGKVRFLGMSGILPHLPDHVAMGVFDVFQIPYSAVQREHEDLIAAAAASGAGTLIRGGVARGGPAEDKDWRQGPIGLTEGQGRDRWQAAGLDDLLDGMSRLEFMLRFTLSHPDLSTTIVGTASIDHLRSNLAVAEKGPLPDAVYAEATQRLAPAER